MNSINFTLMTMLKASSCIFILLLSCQFSFSQDVHFSQRLAGDRQRNATFADHYDGNLQALLAYRQQWQSIGVPFNTGMFMLHKRFQLRSPIFQFFGGIQLLNDQSGDAKLRGTHFGLNLGAALHLGQNTFRAAISPSYSIKSFDPNGLTFPIQYDRNIGGFNENLSNAESFAGNNINFFDVDLAFGWERQFSEAWSITTGASVLNLMEPEESFFAQANQLGRGYGLQVLAKYQWKSKLQLLPYLSYYRNNNASETLIGSAIAMNVQEWGKIDIIQPFLYTRTGIDRNIDALILGSSVHVGKLQLGVSYDFNISNLEIASNYQGGLEFTLVYTEPLKRLMQKRIPCVRY